MSNISNGVLQGIGKPKIPMITAAVALVVDVIVVVALLMFTDLGIYALLVAMIVYAIVVCVMNDLFMKKYLEYKNPWKAAYVSPLIASAVMGLFAFGSYQLVHLAVKSNALSTMFAMMVAVIVYGVLLIKLGALSAAELKTMPGGTKLLRVFRKLHLM